MIHYIVVSGAPGAVERYVGRLSDAVETTRVFDGRHRLHVAEAGTWAVATVSVPDPLTTERFHTDGRSFAVFNGPALGRGTMRAEADAVRDVFLGRGSDGVSASLGGAWNFVGFDPAGGLRALSDFTGQYPLYWGRQDGVVLVSNRTRTIATATGRTGWDHIALSWLFGQNLRGERTPAPMVRLLRAGEELAVDPHGSSDLRRSPEWVWPAPDDEAAPALTDAEWDAVTAELVATFEGLRHVPGRTRLMLSGGKDSRLAAALAREAGIGDAVLAVTRGPEDGPEVQVATEVARVAGLEHRRHDFGQVHAGGGSRAGAEHAFDAEEQWRRLRQHAYRYEGMVSPWDGTNPPLTLTTVNVQGFAGELYKRGNDKAAREFEGGRDDFVRFASRGLDVGGVLHPPVSAIQRSTIERWTDEESARIRTDTLPEKWYVDYRLGHWNGPLAQGKPGHITVTPLATSEAARWYLRLGPRERARETLHFEVLTRIAPDLAAIPFLADTWDPDLLERSPLDLPREPFPTTVTPSARVLAPHQYGFIEQELPRIESLLRDATAETDLALVCDVEKLLANARRLDDLPRPAVRQVFSSIGVCLTLLHRAEPFLDTFAGPGAGMPAGSTGDAARRS